MKAKRKNAASCVCVFSIFLFSLILSNQAAAQIEIKTEKGITVVYNPKTPTPLPGVPSKPVLKEDLFIGKETDKENYWFSALNSIAVDDSGNIYTLDPKEVKIRVFNSKGKLLRVFGRRGQGPGEFSGPGLIKIMPDGNLAVHDVLNRRFSFLTPDGKSIKDVSQGSLLLISGDKFDSQGFLYAKTRNRFGEKQVEELVKLDQNMNLLTRISSIERNRKPRIWYLFEDTHYFDVTSKDELIWLISSKYEMNAVNSEGKLVKRIVKDCEPVRITDAEKERIQKEESSGLPGRIAFEFPKNYPPVQDLFIDDEDRIYVRTYEKDSKGDVLYDIFNPEGRYISRFSLSARERAVIIRKNKLYCLIRESKEGIPVVKRYAMGWK